MAGFRNNANVKAITGELKSHGIDYEIKFGKHIKVIFNYNGRKRKLVCPTSPKSPHSALEARRDVKMILEGKRT